MRLRPAGSIAASRAMQPAALTADFVAALSRPTSFFAQQRSDRAQSTQAPPTIAAHRSAPSGGCARDHRAELARAERRAEDELFAGENSREEEADELKSDLGHTPAFHRSWDARLALCIDDLLKGRHLKGMGTAPIDKAKSESNPLDPLWTNCGAFTQYRLSRGDSTRGTSRSSVLRTVFNARRAALR
jgi:hypothetical protein